MTRLLILLVLLVPLAVLAQDADTGDEETPPAEETSAEAPAADDVSDEEVDELLGLDEEDYSEIEEDDFEASIEVRYEQSVAFPTDI